jgi:hypothetical protein
MKTTEDWEDGDLFEEIYFSVMRVEEKSPLQRNFEIVHDFIMEVANGGFSQYFTEATRVDSPFIVQALESFGAADVAQLVERALQLLFPRGIWTPEELTAATELPWLSSPHIMQQLAEICDQYFLICTQFFKELFLFLQNHPEEFPVKEILAKMDY